MENTEQFIDESDLDIEALRQELDQLNMPTEENEDQPVRKAGRPKNTKKKVEENTQVNEEVVDIFEFARQYSAEKCDAVKLRIYRGGAFLANINFSDADKNIKIKSLSDVQEKLGGGIYTFEIFSVSQNKIIKRHKTQILDLPEAFKTAQNEPLKQESNDLGDFLKRLDSINPAAQQQQPQTQQQFPFPPQKTLVDQLKELTPIVVALAPLFKDMFRKETPVAPAQPVVDLQAQIEEKMERERRRFYDEQDRIDKKIKEGIEEKSTLMGINPPEEKSTLSEIGEIVKSFSGIVTERAKIELSKRRPVSTTPVQPKKVAPPAPKKIVQAAPKVQKAPEVLVQANTLPQDELEGLVALLTDKFFTGMNEQELSIFVMSDPKLLELCNKYDSNTISQKAKEMLQLDDFSFGFVKEAIEKFHDNLRPKSEGLTI